jgi:predicted TIM-barrel fold metal-dependent hydrolase
MPARPPRFVDAHVHFWALERLRYPWLTPPFNDDGPNGSVEPIAHDYGVDDYLADMARWNVAGAVHVDAGAHPDDALAETQWLQSLADERGLPSAIVAFAALDDPNLDALLEAHAAHRSVRGIRHIVNWHPDPRRSYTPRDVTADPAWQAGFGRLARHGLSFDLQCYPAQMPTVAVLAARHDDIPVIINHLGMPVPSDPDGIDTWRHGMRALAALPHVAVKISGVGFACRPWTIEQIRPLILETIDLFGTSRAMIASDVPTDKLFGSPDDHLAAYAEITAGFSDDERDALFAGNAQRIYRID